MEKTIKLLITYDDVREDWVETCLDEMVENGAITDYEII